MKKLFLAMLLILMARPVLGMTYAQEMVNENETYELMGNVSYEGKGYFLYGIYLDNQTNVILIQDNLDNLITDNETIINVFSAYRNQVLRSLGENVTNPWRDAERVSDMFNARIMEKKDAVLNDISSVENVTPQYQSLILNLTSQGAYASKSIELFSKIQDLLWKAKMLLAQSMFNSADGALVEAKGIGPKITLDVSFSFKVNQGNLALSDSMSSIREARKEGLNVSDFETYYDNAAQAMDRAKEYYNSEDYDSIDPEIEKATGFTNMITSEVDRMMTAKAGPNQTPSPENEPTGMAIGDFSWTPYALIITVIVAIAIVIFKRNSSSTYHYKSRRFF